MNFILCYELQLGPQSPQPWPILIYELKENELEKHNRLLGWGGVGQSGFPDAEDCQSQLQKLR